MSYNLEALLIAVGLGAGVTIGTLASPSWKAKERLGLFLAITLCVFVLFVVGRDYRP